MKVKISIVLIIILIVVLVSISKKNMDMSENKLIDYLKLPFINKVKENQKQFGEKVIKIANDLGIKPEWLMITMNNESGVNHRIKNPNSTATGLIQFMEATAKGLGTNTEKLKNMTNVEQLDYVKKYFEPYAHKIKNAADTYLAVFYPAALYKDFNWEFPDWAVKANPIFFKNGTTKMAFNNYVENKYKTYYA